jgi:hypothetical protein
MPPLQRRCHGTTATWVTEGCRRAGGEGGIGLSAACIGGGLAVSVAERAVPMGLRVHVQESQCTLVMHIALSRISLYQRPTWPGAPRSSAWEVV